MILTSLKNPRIKFARKLRDRRWRDKERLTLLEGYRELSRGLEFGLEIVEVFHCPDLFLGKNEAALLSSLMAAGARIDEVTEPILRKLAYRDRPEGLIAVARTRDHRLDDLPVSEGGFYLVAEAIEKPGNLGAMLRSVDAAGGAGMIACGPRADFHNPNVVRASTGALFSVPLAEADQDSTQSWLSDNRVLTLAATPRGETVYTEIDMTRTTALLVGAEQYGLSDAWLKVADARVRIPMLGRIDSLNVATAATLLLFEAARQRGWRPTNRLQTPPRNRMVST